MIVKINKMENTLENKAKFFAQYWGKDIIIVNSPYWADKTRIIDSITLESDSFKHFYLELTPLEQISDEDAIEVARMAHQIYSDKWKVVKRVNGLIHIEYKGNVNDIYHISINTFCSAINANHHFLKTETDKAASFKVNVGSVNISSSYPIGLYSIVDFLRSKGYAVPYMGLSVETLISYGWIKLKSLK